MPTARQSWLDPHKQGASKEGSIVDSFTWADELMLGVHAKIERFGWTGMYVFGERETRTPPWGYTIGLAERSLHPELVIVGLDDCCLASLFDLLATRVTRGERLDDLPDGRLELDIRSGSFPCTRATGTQTVSTCGSCATASSGRRPPQDALQLLWPDDDDRLPDDPAFDGRLRHLQTRLDRPARPHSRRRRRRAA
jgi:Domain of unknown function (DUF4262)